MKYLVIGHKGQLGNEFVKFFKNNNMDFYGADVDSVDIANLDETKNLIDQVKPGVIINCAAYNQVDLAEEKPDLAYKTNSHGVKSLAELSKLYNSFLVHFGTDYVFDGTKDTGLYTENDLTNPINEYGNSKRLGEQIVCDGLEDYLIFRLSWVYGEGHQNFIHKFLGWCNSNDNLKIAFDEVSVPCSTEMIVQTTMKSLKLGVSGLYHLTNSGYASRYEWAKAILKFSGLKKVLYPVSKDIFDLSAKRPGFSAMSNELISKTLNIQIADWEEDLEKYLKK